MVVPSPFGDDAFRNGGNGAVLGCKLVNPTEVNMTVSKLTIVVYPPTANDNDAILEKDTGGATLALLLLLIQILIGHVQRITQYCGKLVLRTLQTMSFNCADLL